MPFLFVVGRVLLVVIFVLSGAQKLMDVPGTAAMIANAVPVPAALAATVRQIEAAAGVPVAQILAILSGVVEFAGGLLIAFNIGTRWVALVVLVFTAATTYYFHDFWNQAGAARADNMVHALKNLSIMGGLLIFVALGSWRPTTPQRLD